MFQKLIDNPEMNAKEQKQIIKGVLTHNVKQNIHQVKLQFNHNYPKIKHVLLKHAKYAIRLALILHTWQISSQLISDKRQSAPADLIYQAVLVNPAVNGMHLLVDLSKTYQDNWRMLVILKLVSQLSASHINCQDFGIFLATYVKMSAAVITAYLKIKNQPTQSNNDRIQSDLQFVNNCQKWVTQSYVKMISSLKGPSSKQEKQITLAAFSQIIGALLENQWGGGQLSVQKLKQIQISAGDYIFKHFSGRLIGQMFITQYRAGNYKQRLKKIQIPQKYEQNTQYAKQGICWLLQQWLTSSSQLYSQQFVISWMLIAYSQSLQSALPIKNDLLAQLKKIIVKNIDWNLFQDKYPLGLILFNVYLRNKEELQFFKQKLCFGQDVGADIRRCRRLLSIDLGQNYIDQVGLIVRLISQKHIKDKQILVLVKAIKFNFSNQELSNLVCQLVESMVHNHGEGRKVATWLVERERQNRRNIDLCVKIEHKLNI